MANTTLFYTRRLLVCTICLLFIIFLSIQVYEIDFFVSANMLKLSSVVLCLTISIVSSPLGKQSKNTFLLQLGLIFTIMADYIFLIHNDDYIFAIGLFSMVQIIYSLRYREGNEAERVMGFIIIYLLIVILYKLVNKNLADIDFIIFIGIFYGICLITSLREAWGLYKDDPYNSSNKMILFGMVLFLLCDINLGLNYIFNQVQASSYILNLIRSISSISIWVYYLPSQILLSLSVTDLH